MARNRRRYLWWVWGLLLFPSLTYLCFPFVAATGLEYYLQRQGFQRVTIKLGYPTFERFSIPVVSLETELWGQIVTLRLNRNEVNYHMAQLFSGMVDRIHFRTISLEMRPTPSDEAPIAQMQALPSAHHPPQTIAELVAPLPILPFREMLVDSMSIHRIQHSGPFQQVSLSGQVTHETGKLTGAFVFQGPNIPSYTFSFSGQPPQDIQVTLQSSASSQPTISLTSTLHRAETDMQLRGSAETDVPKLIEFLTLFLPLNKEWDMASGTLTADWHGKLPHALDLQTALKENIGSVKGTIHLQGALPQYAPYAQDIAMSLHGAFTATHDHLDWSLTNQSALSAQLDLTAFPLPKDISPLIPLHGHTVSIDVPESLHGQLSLTESMPSLTVDGNLHATYIIGSLPLQAEFSLSHVSASSPEDSTAEGTFHLSGQLEKFSQTRLPIKHLSWDLAGNTSFNNETLSLTLSPSSSITATPLPMNDMVIPTTTVAFRNDTVGTYRLTDGTWQVEPAQLKIQIPHLTWKDHSVSLQGINLHIKTFKGSPKTWDTNGDVVLMGVGTQVGQFIPPVTNWKFSFSADPASLRLNLFGETSTKTASLIGRLHHKFSTNKGGVLVKVRPITFSPSAFNFRTAITPWPYPLDITEGELSGSVKLFWTIPPQTSDTAFTINHGETTVTLKHLSGHYDKTIFKNLTTEISVRGVQKWAMPKPALLTIGELSAGITATKIRLQVQATSLPSTAIPRIDVRDLSLKLFGGNIFSERIAYNHTKPHNAFTVHLEGLDLEAILQLEQQEGLHGTGLLDGDIPITVNGNDLTVYQGRLHVRRPGGIIRYQTADGAAQSLTQTHPQMNFVLQALENFHYDVLQVGIEYEPDGTLRLQTRLEGKNPDLSTERPVHVNLNVQENIPALLKSLQVAHGIEEKIEKMLQGR
ncbi:MAG: hypothetical protein GKS05_03245 [Nitrospirales bacterium]|nr:hypothetical protein [Nitrospirales bacterium]